MRIVSLVPAATEIAFALGSGDDVVAVTHDCDYPEAARALPRVTRSTIPAGTSSRDIDVAVRAAAAEGDSTFHVDASVGRAREAASFVASLRERIDRVRERVARLPHPTVVALEWLDPLFSAGHWVPEQVAAAGGVELIGRANARSREISLDDVVAADPDYVLILPCGFDAERAARESRVLIADERWTQLRAVRDGHVLTLDGNAYFSRPGPRVVDGIELLASALHGKVPARVV
ncbi:MAG: cobalamin-binding protein [Chloroflexi bacterium]|nr:MAG: cobalamin-binding protein [Chloroflexota bacterium]